MPNDVLDAWRRKYPGAYDQVDDRVLADAITRKFPGAYDERLKDVLGPRKIEPTKTPAGIPPPGQPAPSLTPGGVPTPPPGGGGGKLPSPYPYSLPSERGAMQDVAISAGKTLTGTATSAAKFATHALFPLGGSVPNEIIRMANAGQKAVDEWLGSLRTEAPPKQPKIPILEQTPTEAAGMVLGGAMIPLPGGGSTGATIAARAISYLKHTLFGTAAFTAVQALPEYLEASSDAERDAILNSLPESVMGQFLVAAGMFGVHEFGGRVPRKTAPFVAAVTEQNGQVPEAFKKLRLTAEQVKELGIRLTPEDRTAKLKQMESVLQDNLAEERKAPDVKDLVARGYFKDEETARRLLGVGENLPDTDTTGTALMGGRRSGGRKIFHGPDIDKLVREGYFKSAEEARRVLKMDEKPLPQPVPLGEGPPYKPITKEEIKAYNAQVKERRAAQKLEQKEKKIEARKKDQEIVIDDVGVNKKMLLGGRPSWLQEDIAAKVIEGHLSPYEAVDKAIETAAAKQRRAGVGSEAVGAEAMGALAKMEHGKAYEEARTQAAIEINSWVNKVMDWVSKNAPPTDVTTTGISYVTDAAHAQMLIDKGRAEEKIAFARDGEEKAPKGPEPPVSAYDGGSPVPSTGFIAMMKKWFSPASLMPEAAEKPWIHMWDSIDASRWNADRNRDIALKTIPDEKMRQQAGRFLLGLPIDPNLPALDGPTSKYIERQRHGIEAALSALKDSGYISANRFKDILTSMFSEPAKARERFGSLSKDDFAKLKMSSLWKLFADGVKNRGLKPATHDIANMVNLVETRMATAAAMQRLKLEIKTIPGLAIPARSVRGVPPKGYTTVDAGHLRGYFIQEDVARVLNNLFSRSAWNETDPLKFLKNTQELLKRTAVSISGFHHQAIFRTMMATGHFDPAGALKGLKAIEENNPILREGATRGLQIRGARPDIGAMIEREAKTLNPNAAKKFLEWWDHKLWGEHVPGAIAYGYMNYVQELTKAHPGWEMDKVYREAVKKTNNSFGLQNLERMGRNKTFQDTLRFLMFAPTWTETRLRMFAGAGKEAADLVRGRGTLADTMYLRQTVGHALVAGVMAEALNVALNGEDKKGSTRRFGELVVPFIKDKRGQPLVLDFLMYLRDPVEFVMHPAKLITNTARYVMGRRSQVVSWMMDEAANEDWKGQKLWRPENTLWQNIKSELGEAASHTIPIIMQHTMDGLNLLEGSIADFKNNAGRDIAAFFGFRTRSDYPIELRLKMESQVSRYPAVRSLVLGTKRAGNSERADKIAREFNENGKRIEQEIRDSGYGQTLGPWWDRNRRFAYIK